MTDLPSRDVVRSTLHDAPVLNHEHEVLDAFVSGRLIDKHNLTPNDLRDIIEEHADGVIAVLKDNGTLGVEDEYFTEDGSRMQVWAIATPPTTTPTWRRLLR